jgi:hypothetical protein
MRMKLSRFSLERLPGTPQLYVFNMKGSILTAAVMTTACAQPIRACDLCAIYSATEAQGGGKGFYAGVATQFTDFGTLQDDGHSVAGQGQYLHSLNTQFFAGYNFNRRFGLQVNLPYVYRDYGDNTMSGNVSGPGDASLVANLLLYKMSGPDWTFGWTGLGGLKFPTGDSGELGVPDSALPPGIGGHDLALGSGSWDGLVGTGFSLRWKRAFLDGQMQYAIRTEGDFQHQYANDWSWSGGPGAYLLLNDNSTVALQAAVSGESKGKDTFAGVPDDDSAETVVYLGPAVSFTWGENFSAHLGVDLPVSRDNSGEQVMPDYRVHAALTWVF